MNKRLAARGQAQVERARKEADDERREVCITIRETRWHLLYLEGRGAATARLIPGKGFPSPKM